VERARAGQRVSLNLRDSSSSKQSSLPLPDLGKRERRAASKWMGRPKLYDRQRWWRYMSAARARAEFLDRNHLPDETEAVLSAIRRGDWESKSHRLPPRNLT